MGQELRLKKRAATALSGSEFSKSISDTSLSLAEREKIIYNEIKSGNIPDFYRKLQEIRDTITVQGNKHTIRYFALPDILAIGSNEDYFYCPYGWHKPHGKAIQPLYNGHSTIHDDYSHGVRLIQNRVWIDGRKTSLQKILRSEIIHPLLSDEGVIVSPVYPTRGER